jgi:hypothetical protein
VTPETGGAVTRARPFARGLLLAQGRGMRALVGALLIAFSVAGCTPPIEIVNPQPDLDGASDDAGTALVALGKPCTPGDDAACATGLCAPAGIYDQTGPLCTYKCDASLMNPMCPAGCNKKGYCKIGSGTGTGTGMP